jgi:hypothetical protein
MIKSKLFGFPATILTDVFIPVEDIQFGHLARMGMLAYQVDQPDN